MLAGQLGSLVYRPAADASGAGYASFTFQVVDDGGTASGGVDTDPTPNRITFTVTPVNDAPTGVNDTGLTAEGRAATGNVLTNDGDIDGDPLCDAVRLDDGGRTATLAGVGTPIARTFTPAAGYARGRAQRQPDGDHDADAPSGADRTITLAEDAFTAADFGFTDPNDSPANGLKAVVITTLGHADARRRGRDAGQSVLAGQLGSLVWRPAATPAVRATRASPSRWWTMAARRAAAWTRIRHPIASPSP